MSDTPPIMLNLIDTLEQKPLPPISSDLKDTASIMSDLMEELTHKPSFDGIQTGFRDLDEICGFRNGDLILLGCGPFTDIFALNLLENITVRDKKMTVCFSPEKSAKVMLRDLLSSMSGCIIREHDCSAEALAPYAEEISRAPLLVDDTTCISARNIRKKCEALQERTNIDFILVRDMHRMWTEENRVYAPTLMKLKLLAMEMDCPVVVTIPAWCDPEWLGETSLNLVLPMEEQALDIPDVIIRLPYEKDADGTRMVYLEKHPDRGPGMMILGWDDMHGYRDCRN